MSQDTFLSCHHTGKPCLGQGYISGWLEYQADPWHRKGWGGYGPAAFTQPVTEIPEVVRQQAVAPVVVEGFLSGADQLQPGWQGFTHVPVEMAPEFDVVGDPTCSIHRSVKGPACRAPFSIWSSSTGPTSKPGYAQSLHWCKPRRGMAPYLQQQRQSRQLARVQASVGCRRVGIALQQIPQW